MVLIHLNVPMIYIYYINIKIQYHFVINKINGQVIININPSRMILGKNEPKYINPDDIYKWIVGGSGWAKQNPSETLKMSWITTGSDKLGGPPSVDFPKSRITK